MSAKDDITIPLEPNCYFSIFNEGNNSENLFYNSENYRYFLIKLDIYMSEYFYFYSYCLLPNHFHLLIKVKSGKEILQQALIDFPTGVRSIKGFQEEDVITYIKNPDLLNLKDLANLSLPQKLTSEKFRRFFLSYAKSINKQQKRKGSLFRKYFRRKKISSIENIKLTIWDIHRNPIKHNIYKDYKTYKWSSFNKILQNEQSKLEKNEVIMWYNNKENYLKFHEKENFENNLDNLILE